MTHEIYAGTAAFLQTEQPDTNTAGGADPPLGIVLPTPLRARVCDANVVHRPELSPREREVLIAWLLTDNKHLVSQGLHISPATVRTHLQRIRAKYDAVGRPAPTKAALVARAIQDGLISVDDL